MHEIESNSNWYLQTSFNLLVLTGFWIFRITAEQSSWLCMFVRSFFSRLGVGKNNLYHEVDFDPSRTKRVKNINYVG